MKEGKTLKLGSEELKKKIKIESEFYSIRSLLGNTWACFYILLGGREAGKSYAVMDYFVWEWKRKGKPFIWLRLTEASTKKMLSNNAAQFTDADIMRRYNLKLSTKGNQVFDDGKPMAKVLSLSTFYSDKGVALFDNEFLSGYNICLDEMNREKNEKKTFDINYAFVNQMENLVRSTKFDMRIFLIGNTLEEASDIMCSFNFIPEQFGRYYLVKNRKLLKKFQDEWDQIKGSKNKKLIEDFNERFSKYKFGKRAVIEYIEPSEKYLNRRANTIADMLAAEESTFTNIINVDTSLVDKRRLHKPSYVIRFSKTEAYTVWDSKIIAPYNHEKVKTIPMAAYLDEVFVPENRDNIIILFHSRGYLFRNLITQKKFKKALELLKPKG